MNLSKKGQGETGRGKELIIFLSPIPKLFLLSKCLLQGVNFELQHGNCIGIPVINPAAMGCRRRKHQCSNLGSRGAGNVVFLSVSRCVFLGAVLFMRIKFSCFRCGKHQRKSDLATDETEFGYQRFMPVVHASFGDH